MMSLDSVRMYCAYHSANSSLFQLDFCINNFAYEINDKGHDYGKFHRTPEVHYEPQSNSRSSSNLGTLPRLSSNCTLYQYTQHHSLNGTTIDIYVL